MDLGLSGVSGDSQRLGDLTVCVQFLRSLGLVVGLAVLGGCVAPDAPFATEVEVTQARYVHSGPTKLTLFTVISNSNGSGAHAALMVNGSQRVLFDPAGTWHHPQLPERNDVHFGITDPTVDFYIDYHSRLAYHTVIQEYEVSPEVAELVLARVQAYGAVPKAHCTQAVTAILRGVPGFENIPSTFFPKKAMQAFGALPGVTTRKVYDDDPAKDTGLVNYNRL